MLLNLEHEGRFDVLSDKLRLAVNVPDKFAKYFSPNPGEGD